MTTYIIVLAFSVSLANVALNKLAASGAHLADNLFSVFCSLNFAMAFLTGLMSLVFMFSFYFVGKDNQIGMANGVIIMGATSMICGTLIGYFYLQNTIHWSEWCIFALVLLLIAIRFLTIISGPNSAA